MALYKGSQKVSWSGNSFNPQNDWTVWQLLTKTANWYDWEDASWGTDINEVNWDVYIWIKDYDSVYSMQWWLYKVLNNISNDDELGLTSWESWQDIANNQSSMNLISHSWSVMSTVANSNVAIDKILNNNTALWELANSWNAMQVIAKSPKAYNKILHSSSAMSIIFSNQVAVDALLSNESIYDLIISDESILAIIANSPSALSIALEYDWIITAISNSSTAMIALASNPQSLSIAKNNSSIVNSLTSNTEYLNEITDSWFVELLSNESSLNIVLANTPSATRYLSSDVDTVVLPSVLAYID